MWGLQSTTALELLTPIDAAKCTTEASEVRLGSFHDETDITETEAIYVVGFKSNQQKLN